MPVPAVAAGPTDTSDGAGAPLDGGDVSRPAREAVLQDWTQRGGWNDRTRWSGEDWAWGATHPDPHIRGLTAGRRGLPRWWRLQLVRDLDATVRQKLLDHRDQYYPQAWLPGMAVLVHDPVPAVRAAATPWRGLPAPLAHELLFLDPSATVRAAAVRNIPWSLSAAHLYLLALDPSPEVRASVCYRRDFAELAPGLQTLYQQLLAGDPSPDVGAARQYMRQANTALDRSPDQQRLARQRWAVMAVLRDRLVTEWAEGRRSHPARHPETLQLWDPVPAAAAQVPEASLNCRAGETSASSATRVVRGRVVRRRVRGQWAAPQGGSAATLPGGPVSQTPRHMGVTIDAQVAAAQQMIMQWDAATAPTPWPPEPAPLPPRDTLWELFWALRPSALTAAQLQPTPPWHQVSQEVLCAWLADPALSPQLLAPAPAGGEEELLALVAEADTPWHPWYHVARAVAASPALSARGQIQMAQHPNAMVRIRLVDTHSVTLPETALRVLGADPVAQIRGTVFGSRLRGWPRAILRETLTDASSALHQNATELLRTHQHAHASHLPLEILATLVEGVELLPTHLDRWTSVWAALPRPQQVALLASPHASVRLAMLRQLTPRPESSPGVSR